MRAPPNLTFLARWRRQSRQEPREQEPADLGTAFGLEATLDQSLERGARDPGAAASGAGWLQRWRSGGRNPD